MIYFDSEDTIRKRAAERDIVVGFIGLGRVGLPLAVTLANQGFPVIGVDVNKRTVELINNSQSPIPDETGVAELIARTIATGTLQATTELGAASRCEVYIVAVPTLIKGEKPDVDAVETVGRALGQIIRPGVLIVLQSTVPPGTARRVFGRYKTSGQDLVAGKDYGLAYSPERTQAPQVLRDLRAYPKILGGIDAKSAFALSEIYGTFAPRVISMKSLEAAELEKVVENSYRDVNIAFANELAQICEIYGADAREVIAAANSQPYSHILNPGLVGGHCIPMDPYYIISDLIDKGYCPKLIKTARDINEGLFSSIVGSLNDDIHKVAIFGLSFKKDVKSFETSHTLKLIRLLVERGKAVVVHDPFITDEKFSFDIEKDPYQACRGADCLIISTAHSAYGTLDLARIKAAMTGQLVIDIRNILKPEAAARAGLEYHGLGRGQCD